MTASPQVDSGPARLEALGEKLELALGRLEQARPFAKSRYQHAVLDVARRIMLVPGGVDHLYRLAPRLETAGLFIGTDWENPTTLLPGLVTNTLHSAQSATVMLECLSELRLLSIANGHHAQPDVSPEHARHFLTQVLALNLGWVFGSLDEAQRTRLGPLADAVSGHLRYVMDQIGIDSILSVLVDEIRRILAQRPIKVDHVRAMIAQIAISLTESSSQLGQTRLGADRLISALFGPTNATVEDPGLDVYRERLAAMDATALANEAQAFARAMHDSGLVSDYHPVFLRWLLDNDQKALIPDALGVSSTGLDVLRTYEALVHALIDEAIWPETAQAVYGLSLLLERGILYAPPVAPALWRQIGLKPSERAEALLAIGCGTARPPRVFLLAGVISVLGQPLGVGQGNNPTCQSARGISMWSYNDPDYLLHLVAQAAQRDDVLMHFEGHPIHSAELSGGLALATPLDTDPVSMVLVPHLDRIYAEMGRRCVGRGEDPHRWINPEFHGWWVGRQFDIAVDIATGDLKDYRRFIRAFYASYHPLHNGNQPVIHPQPAGIASTDNSARFVGWHAISILRVALDQQGEMRVYFYNPNNDSGQDWGDGVVVSTHGNGERFGEASLPFTEFASRLYIFHDDPVETPGEPDVPNEELAAIEEMARQSWAADRRFSSAAAAPGES